MHGFPSSLTTQKRRNCRSSATCARRRLYRPYARPHPLARSKNRDPVVTADRDRRKRIYRPSSRRLEVLGSARLQILNLAAPTLITQHYRKDTMLKDGESGDQSQQTHDFEKAL